MGPFCYIGQGQPLTFQIQKDDKQIDFYLFMGEVASQLKCIDTRRTGASWTVDYQLFPSFLLPDSHFFPISLVAPVNVVPL